MSNDRRVLASAGAKLGAYVAILGLALGGGALVGATLGPEPSTAPSDHDTGQDGPAAAVTGDGLPAGLAVSRDGYTLDLRTAVVEAGAPARLSFVIERPDGRPLTDYAVQHDKEIHLVVVGRDLAGYAHVHPTRDADGVWTVTTPSLAPGSYRAFADFVPAGDERITLGADLTVPGDHQPADRPAPSSEASVDGYDVSFDGELAAGTESELTVTVTRAGQPVTDLQPYLGALGHLVAIRDGDLAYLHVHPLDDTADAGGPQVRFAVEVPSAGTYGLYFDFAHGDDVRTASTLVVATATATAPEADGDVPPDHTEPHGD